MTGNRDHDVPRASGGLGHALALLALALTGAPACAQTIVYVNSAAAPGGNGQTWATAFQDLQDALAAAPPVEVWIAAGTYRPDRGTGNKTLSFRIGMDPPATAVYGGFSGVETSRAQRDPVAHVVVLSGDLSANDAPGFANRSDNSGTVVILFANGLLDGVTIRGGNDGGGIGGGLSLNSGSLRSCTLADNQSAVQGGAIGGSLGAAGLIDQCRFIGNLATGQGIGGAIYSASGTPQLTVTNSVFQGNQAQGFGGGAIWGGPVLMNCTFDSNAATGPAGIGGAMYGAVGAVSACAFTNNSAFKAGALYSGGESAPVLSGCTFGSNHATNGGGVYFDGGTPKVQGCTFTANVGTFGGAAASVNASPVFIACAFRQNVGFYGGAGNLSGGRPVVLNSRFMGNTTVLPSVSGGSGGALYLRGGASAAITGSIFSGNYAENFGGAIVGESLLATPIVSCTFSLNRADLAGGGVFCVGAVGPAMSSCILWNNSDPSGTGQAAQFSGGAPFMVRYSTVVGWTGTLPGPGNSGADPMLIDPAGPDLTAGTDDDNVHLHRFSPAVDSADNAALPPDEYDLDGDSNFTEPLPRDADGNPRQRDDPNWTDTGAGAGPATDRGALEYQPPVCYANCDASITSPVLNVNDFACFLNRYASGDTYANCDGSTIAPVLNVLDFSCFLNQFAAGCP